MKVNNVLPGVFCHCGAQLCKNRNCKGHFRVSEFETKDFCTEQYVLLASAEFAKPSQPMRRIEAEAVVDPTVSY